VKEMMLSSGQKLAVASYLLMNVFSYLRRDWCT